MPRKNTEAEKPEARQLLTRPAVVGDIPGLRALYAKVYPELPNYTSSMLHGQINAYPDGQFVADYEGEVVGYAATFRIMGQRAKAAHT